MKTKKENIVSYTVEELEEMVRTGTTGTDRDRIDRMTQEEVNRHAIEDMDELGIPHDWFKEAQPINLQPVIISGGEIAHSVEATFAINEYVVLAVHPHTHLNLVSIQGEYDSARLDSLV